MESKTEIPGITVTYFQPKTNITVNRENIYMGAKRTNDIPNYGAQVEFIIKDLVWLVFILIVVILVIYHEPLLANFRSMTWSPGPCWIPHLSKISFFFPKSGN